MDHYLSTFVFLNPAGIVFFPPHQMIEWMAGAMCIRKICILSPTFMLLRYIYAKCVFVSSAHGSTAGHSLWILSNHLLSCHEMECLYRWGFFLLQWPPLCESCVEMVLISSRDAVQQVFFSLFDQPSFSIGCLLLKQTLGLSAGFLLLGFFVSV